LGGFLGRKSDGLPAWQTLARLVAITGYVLGCQFYHPVTLKDFGNDKKAGLIFSGCQIKQHIL
jgi:hypothetical protein